MISLIIQILYSGILSTLGTTKITEDLIKSNPELLGKPSLLNTLVSTIIPLTVGTGTAFGVNRLLKRKKTLKK